MMQTTETAISYHATFMQWLTQGGDYVLWLSGIVIAITAIAAAFYKGYKKFTEPTRKVSEESKKADQELHERIDAIEGLEQECAKKFSNDLHSINSLRREQDHVISAVAGLTEGVFLIIQHLVTNDHVQDMEKWMIDYAKNTTNKKKDDDSC